MKVWIVLYTVEAAFRFDADPGDPTLGDFLDDAAVHLEGLGAEDLVIVADGSSSEFSISLLITATGGESIETVVGKGMGLLRTAFHACNGGTANWPTVREALLHVNVTPTTVLGDPENMNAKGALVRPSSAS